MCFTNIVRVFCTVSVAPFLFYVNTFSVMAASRPTCFFAVVLPACALDWRWPPQPLPRPLPPLPNPLPPLPSSFMVDLV